jgi:LytS/YehU family sensor histidine kinase
LFQYQLTGYHKDWITSSDRQVNFPRLLPGTYTLQVRSSANGRFDNSDQATIRFTIRSPFWKTWWFIMLASAMAVLLIYGIMQQRVLQLKKWEGLKQEKIKAELQTLRAQVNPHFLFNSFNTLMGVIEDNPEKALEYTEQLSAFYRNMLTYRETDLISLSEEAKLLQTYIYLQQQRFGTGLHYSFNVSDQDLHHYQIPPLTLQLLAENAIKHNTVSASTPLNLQILKEGDYLIVNNSINHKRKRETGEGMGLKNITHRYALFSDKTVTIEEDEKIFSVRLPLIKNKHHAHPDH